MNLQEFIRASLAEDVGPGDYTSLSTIPEGTQGSARLLVKDNGILAGVDVATAVISEIDPSLKVDYFITDGSRVKKGDIAFHIHGDVRSILMAERLLLNCMQRMSGIATVTDAYVQQVKDLNVRILDTRKTTPLMRQLEKWAVRIGGGYNHRMGLYDMILIKDNHVDASGGIQPALIRAKAFLTERQLSIPIEIETRNLDEVQQALDTNIADRIMLDNFDPETLKEAVKLINKRAVTEASGGINLDTVRTYALTGVDELSVGALTHSVKSLDLSLKITH